MIGPRSRGFSLIEMIIVIVIISLLAMLVTPRLTKSLQHLEVRSASKKISAILRTCRSESVNRSRIYSVSFDTTSRLLSVQSTEEGEEKPAVERSYPFPEEVQIEKIDVGKVCMTLGGGGHPGGFTAPAAGYSRRGIQCHGPMRPNRRGQGRTLPGLVSVGELWLPGQ